MFAPKVAKPQLVEHRRLGRDPVGQALFLRRSIGNQATLRLLEQHRLRSVESARTSHHEVESVGDKPPIETAPHGISWNFSNIPVFPLGRASQPQAGSPLTSPPSVVHTGLVVGEANGPLEHEADRVAEQVMRMPGLRFSIAPAHLKLSRKCDACEAEEKKKLQMKSAATARAAGHEAPPIVHEVLHSPGEPLDAATCAFFAPRFGHDFSHVRIHTDERAAASARAVGALAYVVGQHIAFAARRFAPSSDGGRQLLAHELAHVVQQAHGAPVGMVHRVHMDAATGRQVFDCPDYAGDSKLEACLNDEDRLGPGERSETVAKVQRGLLKDGADLGPTGADGVYGYYTAQAVRAFKRKYMLGFEQYADVGPGTTAKLDALCTQPGPTPPTPPGPVPPNPPVPAIACSSTKNPDHFGAGDNPHLGQETEQRLKVLIALDCLLPSPTGMCEDGEEAQNAHDEAAAKAESLLDAPPMDKCGPPAPGGSVWPGSAKLPGRLDGPDDAFRHCFASCVLASRTSSSWAERVGTDHENSQDPSSLPGQMDLHNNFMGRSFSKLRDESGCETSCVEAVRSGSLRTVRVNAPNCSDEVCLGPSDQPWP